MTLRKKVVLYVLLLSLVLWGALYGSLFLLLKQSFKELENNIVEIRINRVKSNLNFLLDSLRAKAADWGEWDDAYNFTIDHNEEFIIGNLNEISLVNLDVSLIAFTDIDSDGFFGYAIDSEQKFDEKTITAVKERVADVSFRSYFMSGDRQEGIIVLTDDGFPMVLTAKQVLRSDKSGPVEAYLLMGRYLDPDFVDYRFGDISLSSTQIERIDSPDLSVDFWNARKNLILGASSVIAPVDNNLMNAYIMFEDYKGDPAFIFRLESNREVYNAAQKAQNYVFISLLAIILIFIIVFLQLISWLFIRRLLTISQQVKRYQDNPNQANFDIKVSGADELSQLAASFNVLVKEISSNRDFYKNLLERLPDIIILIKEGRAIYVNYAWEQSTGYRQEEILGQNILNFVAEEDRPTIALNMQSRFAGQEVPPYEVKVLAKDSTPITMRINAKIINYHGEIVDLAVLTDVSAQAKAQLEIQKKVDELEHLNRVMINREAKMIELKKKIAELEKNQ